MHTQQVLRIAKRTLVLAAIISILIAFAGTSFGWIRTYRVEDPAETCDFARFGTARDASMPEFEGLIDTAFPPQSVCYWKDGHTLYQVPESTRSTILTSLGLASVSALSAILIQLHSRRRTPSHEDR